MKRVYDARMAKQTAKKQTTKQTTKRGRPTTGEVKMGVGMTLRVPKELRDAATAKSKRTGVAVSFVVRKSLEEWVASDE